MKPRTYTPEMVELVRELAREMPDPAIAKRMGLSIRRVGHIRDRESIRAFLANPWTPERLEKLRSLYISKGLPAGDVGKHFGIGASAVRRVASRNGFKRHPSLQHANIARVNRERAARYQASKPAKPVVSAANDAELVADYMARRGVTVLPPGRACGLTAWEQALGTARPPGSSHKEQSERHRRSKAPAA